MFTERFHKVISFIISMVIYSFFMILWGSFVAHINGVNLYNDECEAIFWFEVFVGLYVINILSDKYKKIKEIIKNWE